jgi:hypothetical protein
MTKPTGKRPKVKTDRGFVMSSAWYTHIGNLPENWSASASQLFAAAMILRQEREKEQRRFLAAKPGRAGPVSVAIGTDSAERLLTAFGLETLLKAVWLRAGNTLVADGKYVGMPCERQKKPRWHDLVAICYDLTFAIDQSERQILTILSDVGRYHGRYPIARHWEQMEPMFYWSEDWDTAIGRIITRLWRQLGFSAAEVPIGGAPLS